MKYCDYQVLWLSSTITLKQWYEPAVANWVMSHLSHLLEAQMQDQDSQSHSTMNTVLFSLHTALLMSLQDANSKTCNWKEKRMHPMCNNLQSPSSSSQEASDWLRDLCRAVLQRFGGGLFFSQASVCDCQTYCFNTLPPHSPSWQSAIILLMSDPECQRKAGCLSRSPGWDCFSERTRRAFTLKKRKI